MARTDRKVDGAVQERLREVAAELRGLMYGEMGCPEWGTRFSEIEDDGMSVGRELSRLLMEQSVGEQTQHMPPEALETGHEQAQSAGTSTRPLETEAGEIAWEEPRAYLSKARKSFFPSREGTGD